MNDVMAQTWHVCCIQEAFSESVQHPLFDSRGLESEVSRDRAIMLNSGGSGYNMIRTPMMMPNDYVTGFSALISMETTHLNLMQNRT